ncbi:unnamed protein product [Anisakis simplex]|uniref:Ground-like domain-containing protein n=1 Tax=Anisakis simplex TaxID=6269 RepID=A0A0M3J1R7_ANISI|nr:unnamed protein product [Anisakis simplex]
MRLRQIIISNIIDGDAERSKRAIQLVAENELDEYYNVICGVGQFSYIAHADEFCLSALKGVNCYVFSSICLDEPDTTSPGYAKKHKTKKSRAAAKNKMKHFLNMN